LFGPLRSYSGASVLRFVVMDTAARRLSPLDSTFLELVDPHPPEAP
jgi:hypothetical protein